MKHREFARQLAEGLDTLDQHWAQRWDQFETDPTLQIDNQELSSTISKLAERLAENYPYHHPRYAGQMLKPPHPVAMLAYALAMQINPNNHALDGGIATSKMEKGVVADLARMFHFPDDHLGHLTSSGTIANLEALWIARSIHPEKVIVFSDQAHYTHARACDLLRVEYRTVASDSDGRIKLEELDCLLDTNDIGTVVATAGTTGLGAVDPIHEIRNITADRGIRLHVDAAYGGFFSLLARREDPPLHAAPFLAIADADSVVIDPHKHGLQPYGCGAVIFRDPVVGQYYQHDSPYTYFTSDELHLGEISLECSRAGAAAAACWATFRCFPLEPNTGLGPVLSKCRDAALAWADLLRAHSGFQLVTEPELDIVNFYPIPDQAPLTASAISGLSEAIFNMGMENRSDPMFLATLKVQRSQLEARDPAIVWDEPLITVLRSVVMKPEHANWIPTLQNKLDELYTSVIREGSSNDA